MLALFLLLPTPSYLTMDLASGGFLEDHWPEPEQAVPMGSLVKPFLALAYGASHGFRYPVLECRQGCWLPRGHGRVDLVRAIAYSCNVYFEALAPAVESRHLAAVASRLGLPRPPAAGWYSDWSLPPRSAAHAYRELARRSGEPGVREILTGMGLAAMQGTGAESHTRALIKTGTAPCRHRPKAPGDGFAVLLYPAEAPRRLLLIRVHGSTGAKAAAAARTLVRP